MTAPNFESLDGESVSYEDGAGGGCSASWYRPASTAEMDAVRECKNMIPSKPLRVGAYYEEHEFSYGAGRVENAEGFRAPSVCP